MTDPIAEGARLRRTAVSQADRGRIDLARRDLMRALSVLSVADLAADSEALRVRVRVLITLSVMEAELYGSDHGMQRLQQAATLMHQLQIPDLVFAVHSALGLHALRRGEIQAALTHFGDAESTIDQAPAEEACVLLLNRGSLYLQSLDLSRARADFERCLALVSAQPDLSQLAFMARHNLGYLEFLAGTLPAALARMEDAAQLGVEVSLAISHLDRARVLIEAGLTDAADKVLIKAIAEFRRGRQHQELAESELARAECAMLAGDLAAARELAKAARAWFRRRGNDRWRRTAELMLVQTELAAGRRPSRLVGQAQQLAAEFDGQGLDLQARTARLTGCAALISAGRTSEAIAEFSLVGAISRTDPITAKVHQRAVSAVIAKASGNRSKAVREIRTGLNELARHQAQFGSIDLQTAGAIHGRRLVELDGELALSTGSPDAVFNAIERGRAISTRLSPVTPVSAESAQLLAELRLLTENARTLSGDPDAADQVAALRRRIRVLHDQLSSISWQVLGDRAANRVVTMSQTREVVEDLDKVLIVLWESPTGLSAVRVGGGTPRILSLATDQDVGELIRRVQADLNILAYPSLPQEMRAVATASLRRSLNALDETLIAPLQLPDKPLVIIPTARLAALPWGCLPSLRGRPVEVAPTASLWLGGTLAADRTAGELVVDSFAGPGLESSEQESAAVARVWQSQGVPATNHGSRHATLGRVADALSSATIVHVAAHGQHDRQSPLFSSLQLADGPMFAYEIDPEHMAPHIILSACELGQNSIRAGEERLGLMSVLLQMDAQCVVAGVAHVSDETACRVMGDYHRRLAEGTDSASALAASTVASDDAFVPFTCFGSSWRATGPAAG